MNKKINTIVHSLGLLFSAITLPALAAPEVTVNYNNSSYVISYLSTSGGDPLLQNQIWFGNQSLAQQFSALVNNQLGGVNVIIAPDFVFGPFFLYTNNPSATSSAWLTSSLNENGICACDPGNYAYVVSVTQLVSLANLSTSLVSSANGFDSNFSSTEMLINGAHSRPLSRLVAEGEKSAWIAGDWGRDDHGNHDGSVGVAELGGGYNFGPAQVNLTVGKTWAKQSLVYGGDIDADGQYVMVEGIIPISNIKGLYATVGTYGQWGSADIRRGYLNANIADASNASPDTHIWGVRARLDLENAFAMKSVEFSPYVDLSYAHSHMDGYTEHGGSLPAQFDARNGHDTEVHVGLNAAMPVSNTKLNLVANIEADQSVNHRGASSSGQVIGLFSFNLPGQHYESNWLKAGLGAEGMLGKGKASLMLNGTTKSGMPNAWLAASYQLAF